MAQPTFSAAMRDVRGGMIRRGSGTDDGALEADDRREEIR
jgi:hypothetical protein